MGQSVRQSRAIKRQTADRYSLNRWARRLLYAVMWSAVHALTKTTFSGMEHVPSEEGIIITTNHLSIVDTPILFLNPARPDITGPTDRRATVRVVPRARTPVASGAVELFPLRPV